MNKGKHPAVGTPGASSLMVIFAVLCIAVFAILSLSTALAGERLERISLDSAEEYYQADCKAEKILSELRSGIIPDGVENHDGVFSFSVPISETRTLKAVVQLENDKYSILSWQAVYTSEWSADDKLSIWSGD